MTTTERAHILIDLLRVSEQKLITENGPVHVLHVSAFQGEDREKIKKELLKLTLPND
jgi:hypothetical protein